MGFNFKDIAGDIKDQSIDITSVVSEIRSTIVDEINKAWAKTNLKAYHKIEDVSSDTPKHILCTHHCHPDEVAYAFYSICKYHHQMLKYWDSVHIFLPVDGITVTYNGLLEDDNTPISDEHESMWNAIEFLLDDKVKLMADKSQQTEATMVPINVIMNAHSGSDERHIQIETIKETFKDYMILFKKPIYLRFYWRDTNIGSYVIKA